MHAYFGASSVPCDEPDHSSPPFRSPSAASEALGGLKGSEPDLRGSLRSLRSQGDAFGRRAEGPKGRRAEGPGKERLIWLTN